MTRRYDPERRDRIIDATLECIAADGVAGTTHRKVAGFANVPLGSMTYHFASMDALLGEAFARFADTSSAAFDRRLADAPDRAAALDVIVDIVHDARRSQREHVLTFELYTLAARRAEFRSITERWMQASRDSLARHFPQAAGRVVDAYIEGASIHVALDDTPQSRTLTRHALEHLTEAAALSTTS